MVIKSDAEQAHFLARPRERQLALALTEGFDVEYGNTIDNLSFWFASPHAHIRERFGLYREVLIIYSRYQRTDARVLTSLTNILDKPQFRDRAESVVTLVIHEGSEEDVKALQSPQDRILVAIRGEDLLSPDRGPVFLRALLATQIGAADLFGVSSPLESDTYFFGRQAFVEQLAVKTFMKGHNSGVFGLRKTGKTSVLKALQRRGEGHKRVVTYVDCENPSLYRSRWWGFLQRTIAVTMENLGVQFDMEPPYTADDAGFRFASDLKRLLTRSAGAGVTILFDEIEHITPRISGLPAKHWDEDFIYLWQTVRAVQQDNPSILSFVVAGVNPACVHETHFQDLPNPLFQLATPLFLEPLDTPAIRQMVRFLGRYSGMKFEEETYDYLAQRFGGHAFLIRLACSEVWNAADTSNPTKLPKVGMGHFEALQSEIRSRLAQPIKDILLSLVWWYPDEYDLLRLLAEGDADFVRQHLEESTATLQFARYGLVDQSTGQFLIRELQTFLIDAGSKYVREISPFRRSEVAPELLPRVPDLNRLGQLFELKANLEIGLRRIIIIYLGIGVNWDDQRLAKTILLGLKKRGDGTDPKEVFVGRRPQEAINELFLDELRAIILNHWQSFEGLFGKDRNRFERIMRTINLARRFDSHTKPITDKQFQEFETSYRWLLGCLDKLPTQFASGLPG